MITALLWIHVLTFNIWALPDAGFRVFSPLRSERVAAICETLREHEKDPSGWDVVLLQEVWQAKDRDQLKKCGYGYFADRDDPRLPLDSGLLILSRFPLDAVERLVYPASGDFSRIAEDGEALARKSALLVRVMHPKRPFWVANTHLVSFYEGPKDRYLDARRRQFARFAGWAREKAGTEPLVVGGDWNFGKESPLWKEVPTQLPSFTEGRPVGLSCTLCPPNTMHRKDEGKVDHLFASPAFQAAQAGIAMDRPMEIKNEGGSPLSFSLSDHFGWETAFGFDLVR